MFSELVHGLMTRTMREAGMDHLAPNTRPLTPSLRLGVIPAGTLLSLEKSDQSIWCSIHSGNHFGMIAPASH